MGPCNEVVFLGGVERRQEEETTEQGWVSSGAGVDLFEGYGLARSPGRRSTGEDAGLLWADAHERQGAGVAIVRPRCGPQQTRQTALETEANGSQGIKGVWSEPRIALGTGGSEHLRLSDAVAHR